MSAPPPLPTAFASLRRARHSARLLWRVVDNRLRGRPLLLSHLVTCRCPCACATCLWRGVVEEELSVEQIEPIYADAARAGVAMLAVWGGEPMVRADLPAILAAGKRERLLTTLITSGWRFHDRADELAGLVDVLIFSLDHPSTAHDQMRGRAGLFEAVTTGIQRVRREWPGTRVYLNAVISRLNADAILDLVALARRLRAPIYLNPLETGLLGKPDGSPSTVNLALPPEELASLCRELIQRKRAGDPICNSETFLRQFIPRKQPYQCHARKVCIEMWPNGELRDCLDRSCPVADLRRERLSDVLARPEIRRRRLATVDCCVCNNANVIDTSNVWALRRESIYSLLQRYLRGS